MKHIIALSLVVFMAILLHAQTKNVLIYTKNGKGYVHDNIEESVKALAGICSAQGWEFTVSDDAAIFTNENIKQFQCIVFSNTNNEAFDSDEQKAAFQAYIRQGGGFVGIHSACGSERQWPWFWAMLGGKFVRHPKLQLFPIKVVDPNHPATQHLPEIWAWEDEFYYMNQLNPDIHVLLAGDLSKIEDDQKTTYPGEVFGQYFPLSWSHSFDGGRQFYTALGHKGEYYQNPAFVKHLEGGMKWAMGLE